MNEREYLARLERATPDEFLALLRRPSADEERVLRTYFGTARYERLRIGALRGGKRGAKKQGNVVILHGIMGGELNVRHDGKDESIWISLLRIPRGALGWLRMDEKGVSQFDVRATGMIKRYYAELVTALATDWNAQAFPYDWRRDLDELADDLATRINGWFGPDAPVNFVAHSMGGLVARTFIQRQPKRWAKGGKLIMLGTPNHGSFAIPQVITGTLDAVRWLERIDFAHDLPALLEILNHFPGSFQMLPSPLIMPTMAPLYQANTWAGRGVPQGLLDRARKHHDTLAGVVDGTRMNYIAGGNQRTFDDIQNWSLINTADAYSATMNGDGTVPHRLGFLEENGKRIPTWFIEESHGNLPRNEDVIPACQQLLAGDDCLLSKNPPVTPGARGPGADRSAARIAATPERVRAHLDEERLLELTARLGAHARGPEHADSAPLSSDEVEAADILLRQFLGTTDRTTREVAFAQAATAAPPAPPPKPPSIEIALRLGGIDDAPRRGAGAPDAVAVGHYEGVKPQNAELALDRAISAALETKINHGELLLTRFTERGVLGGGFGQLFHIPDPRDPGRIVVIAGMGQPGRCGAPEIKLLVQQLVWALGALGRKHLETVVIGAGAGNLSRTDALEAWLGGIRRALTGTSLGPGRDLQRVTFVEFDPRTCLALHRILEKGGELAGPDLTVKYKGLTGVTAAALLRKAREKTRAAFDNAWAETAAGKAPNHAAERTVRIEIAQRGPAFEFAALTPDASIPQRDIEIDPRLAHANADQLAAARDLATQREWGLVLQRLLIPEDLRETIRRPGAPLAITVDASTARLPWEMLVLGDPAAAGEAPAIEQFIGASSGVTRQFRTRFAPISDPPMLHLPELRVLVVADPAEDAPLPGAQAEGQAVAEEFERFGESSGCTVTIVRLFGPAEATRINVLRQLLLYRFDFLHFAGHCFFKADDPAGSGWLFSDKKNEILSARELQRVDRVPRFVFSNACESGITPDRAELRNAALAPSFAEAFFARGVANFVCTAWPVDDQAALAFARRVYRGLLGTATGEREPMHAAMREARRTIAGPDFGTGGLATWGAYQHYGDPWFRVRAEPPPPPAAPPRGPKRRRKK